MRPILVASIDLDKIEERSQIGPRRRNDLPQGASVQIKSDDSLAATEVQAGRGAERIDGESCV